MKISYLGTRTGPLLELGLPSEGPGPFGGRIVDISLQSLLSFERVKFLEHGLNTLSKVTILAFDTTPWI